MNNNKMKKMPTAVAAMTSLDNFSKLLVLWANSCASSKTSVQKI